jgi:hypothetical protein
MRARKVKLPLTLECLMATLVPGKLYTPRCLSLLYEGTEEEVERVLREGCAQGVMDESAERSREHRGKRYWLREDYRPRVAGPRTQPAHMTGPLTGYDLMALARLSTGFRRQ